MEYFIGCLHIGHQNLAAPGPSEYWRGFNRGFSSVEEHDETILDAIASTVTPVDKLFLLGDLTLKTGQDPIHRILDRIPCKNVYLCIGNHDKTIEKLHRRFNKRKQFEPSVLDRFTLVNHRLSYKKDGQTIIMTHEPVHSWAGIHRNVWHVHSHVHNPSFQLKGRAFNANLENIYDKTGEYKPVSFDWIASFMQSRTFEPVENDSHKSDENNN